MKGEKIHIEIVIILDETKTGYSVQLIQRPTKRKMSKNLHAFATIVFNRVSSALEKLESERKN